MASFLDLLRRINQKLEDQKSGQQQGHTSGNIQTQKGLSDLERDLERKKKKKKQ